MATHAAARTRRMRIGTAVSLAPFYHPLRLAEEIALVDHLSGGRVNWGVGRGFSRAEFDAFGVPVEESAGRFRENVEIVLEAWKDAPVTHHGEHFHVEGVDVLPKPLQQPHPPVWMAATSEGAIDWAAGRGFSILMDPHCSHADLGAKRRRYGEQLAAAGHADSGRDIPRRGAQWTVGSYIKGGANDGVDPVERYVDEVIVHGTPEMVIDQLAELKETASLNYLLAAPLSQATFAMLTDKVLPAIG
jgi:alkanesulfonate monooxygenase SsuD/methylene tetrahydromethanopterin reductase-like flavin-dependent oxidoreductase (luciferase family)